MAVSKIPAVDVDGKLLSDDDDNEFVALPVVSETDEPDIELMNTLHELGEVEDDARVMVFRYKKDRGSQGSYITTYSPNEFTLDILRDRHGGGDFRIRVISKGRIRANKVISVEEVDRPVNQPVVDQTILVNTITETMSRGIAELGKLFLANQPPPQPIRTTKDILDEMLVMKQVMGPGDNSGTSVESMLGLLKTGMEMAKGSNAETNENDVFAEMLKTFSPVLTAVMTKEKNEQTQTPQLNGPTAQPIKQPPTTQPQSPLPTEQNEMNIMVKQAIKFLVNQAERDTDPLPYAYVVLDHIGDDDVARQLVSDPDYLSNIGRIDDRVLNNSAIRQWFETLREAVLQTLNESDSVGENVTTTGGLDAPKSVTGTGNETTG